MSRGFRRPEPPLPPLENPLIVEDEIYTASQIVKSRETLTNCIETLSKRVKEALTRDKVHRYALRMTLYNRVKHPQRKWDRFEVQLPKGEVCWNDVSLVDIEFRIIQAIVINIDEDTDYSWYKFHVSIDEFIKPEVKQLIDELDSNEVHIAKKSRTGKFQKRLRSQ